MTPPRRPTDAELALLAVLWERGPSTVREVLDALANPDTGYTTVLKQLQIMQDKGLVVRDESQRAHRYKAKVGQKETQRRLVRDLVDKAFGGSPARLVQQALSSRRASREELEEIRRLLEDYPGDEA